MILLLLSLLLQPLELQKDLASKRFDTRVSAVRKISELTDLCIPGLLILERSEDAQVSDYARIELELRLEYNERLQLKNKLKKTLELIPEPQLYTTEWYDYWSLFGGQVWDNSEVRKNLKEITSKDYYFPYILVDLYAFNVLKIEEVIKYTSSSLPNEPVLDKQNALYYLILDRHCGSSGNKFWTQLKYIKENDLFFMKGIK